MGHVRLGLELRPTGQVYISLKRCGLGSWLYAVYAFVCAFCQVTLSGGCRLHARYVMLRTEVRQSHTDTSYMSTMFYEYNITQDMCTCMYSKLWSYEVMSCSVIVIHYNYRNIRIKCIYVSKKMQCN